MGRKKTGYKIGSKILRKPLFYGMIVIVLEAKLADHLISTFYPTFVLWMLASALIQVFILYLAMHIVLSVAYEELHRPLPER